MTISANFYMVYVDGERGPTVKHETLDIAKGEAARLSQQFANIGKNVYVLKPLYIVNSEIVTIDKVVL